MSELVMIFIFDFVLEGQFVGGDEIFLFEAVRVA